MARRKPPQDKKVLFSKLESIWTDVTVEDWLLLASDLNIEGGWTRHGPHVKGRCPFHDETTPSFCITPAGQRGGIAFCFGCRRSWTNPIYFVAALKKCSHGDAVLWLKKRFGRKISVPEAYYEKIRDHERHYTLKNEIAEFLCNQLLEAIRLWPDDVALTDAQLYWAKPAIDFLMSRRFGETAPNELRPVDDATPAGPDPWGIWQMLCGSQTIGVLAPTAIVQGRFGIDSEQYKWYANYFADYLSQGNQYVGWVVFVMHDGPRSVCSFKIRCPSTTLKDFRIVEDPYKEEYGGFRGFFGLNYYRTYFDLKSPDDSYVHTCNVHEGEPDALAAMAQQIRRGSEDFFALSMGGASAQGMDRLQAFGVSRVRVMPDDDPGGVNFVTDIVSRTKSKRMSFQVFKWPAEYAAYVNPNPHVPAKVIKDADEAIKALGYPKWARHVQDDTNYASLSNWCADRADEVIQRTAVNDPRQQSRIAQEWGALISDHQELLDYCRSIGKVTDLDQTLLMRDISAQDEDEEEFVERLGRALLEHYHPVGIQNAENRKKLLVLWHKKDRRIMSVVLGDERAVETLLAPHFGAIYEFIRDHVAAPSFLANEGEDTVLPMQVKILKYRQYIAIALLRMSKGLPTVDTSQSKGQGLHVMQDEDGLVRGYVVNGRDVFHLSYASDGGFTATPLDGPSHGDCVFANDDKAWQPGLTQALIESNIDVVALFEQVHEMVSTGWSWRYQVVDSIFLAAHLLCLSVMSAFHRQTSIFVTAESSSGKSKFVGGLVSGHEFPRMRLIGHATHMSHYTPASIRQKRNNSPLTLVLEEFEDYGDNESKSRNVRGVLEMMRDGIGEGDISVSVGTTTGEAKTYNLRCSLMCAAIKPLRDVASLNRFMTFELAHDPGHQDPQDILLGRWGEIGMRAARRDLSVAFMRHIPALMATQAAVESEFSTGALFPPNVASRFRQALYPVLTMLRFLASEAERMGKPAGLVPDYKRFALEFAETRKDQLSRLRTTTENEQIFQTIIGSPMYIKNDANRADNSTSVRRLLSDLNTAADINKTHNGVYYDARMEWIIIDWIEAKQGVLSGSSYRDHSANYLKQISERSPYHISQDDVKSSLVLDRMIEVMGPCHSPDSITVFSVRHMLDEVRKKREESMKTAAQGLKDPSKDENDKPQESDDIVV